MSPSIYHGPCWAHHIWEVVKVQMLLFSNNNWVNICRLSQIWTQIIRVEGLFAGHLTTTTIKALQKDFALLNKLKIKIVLSSFAIFRHFLDPRRLPEMEDWTGNWRTPLEDKSGWSSGEINRWLDGIRQKARPCNRKINHTFKQPSFLLNGQTIL